MTVHHQPYRRIVRFEAYDDEGTLYEFHGIANMTMNFVQTVFEPDPVYGYRFSERPRTVLDSVELKMFPNHEGPIITITEGKRA